MIFKSPPVFFPLAHASSERANRAASGSKEKKRASCLFVRQRSSILRLNGNVAARRALEKKKKKKKRKEIFTHSNIHIGDWNRRMTIRDRSLSATIPAIIII